MLSPLYYEKPEINVPANTNFNSLDLITFHHFFMTESSVTHFQSEVFNTFYTFNSKSQHLTYFHSQDATYNEALPLPNFLHLRQSTVISFFVDNMIDVPNCFKKSKSLYNKAFELPFLKCVNVLMRHGKKNQILKIFNTAVNTFTMTYMDTFTKKAFTDS